MMSTFLAIYRGETIGSARLLAVSADPGLVADVITRLLAEEQGADEDPVLQKLASGKRGALREIQKEMRGGKVLQLNP